MAHVKGSASNDSAYSSENQQKCETLNLTATPEKVRIVLFKECMFKERQLLFDSHCIPNSSEENTDSKIGSTNMTNSEIKIGTLFAKNDEESNHLTEMIFGSTAMKYHETYYKMHNVSSPERIIFTQVFVPRRLKVFRKSSGTSFSKSKTNRSSSDLLFLSNADTSGSSLSGLSDYSSRSDSFSIFRKGHLTSSRSTSTTIDSGFSELSLGSGSSLSYYGDSFVGNGSSFAFSNTSLADIHGSFSSRRNSSEDYQIRTNFGYSRLGLALILVVASENDMNRNLFIQHTNFVESILWRLRQYIEIALNSPGYFVALMLDISKHSANWVLDLASGLGKWTKESHAVSEQQNEENAVSRSNFGNFTSKTLMEFFQNKLSRLRFPKSLFMKKEEDEFELFCELLRELDTKETNFFLSTLLTAVLTHHTGWIASCYSPKELILTNSYNALWRQLMDLQGSTGFSRKMSKTIIYGQKADNIIGRIVDFLRYFIRYFRVQKRKIERLNIASENEIVDEICDRAFGKTTESPESQISEPETGLSEKKSGLTKTKSGLIRTKTLGMDLSKMAVSEDEHFQEHHRSSVLFILGDNERLENLQRSGASQKKSGKSGNKRYPRADSLEIVQEIDEKVDKPAEMKIIDFPLPKVKHCNDYSDTEPFEGSLINGSPKKFVPDMIIQGTNVPENEWTPILKTDLSLSSYPSYDVDESVVVLGDTNKWGVQLWSSSRSRMNKGHLEESVDASQLVSNILEVVLQMWEMDLSKQCCMTFIEQRLLEICLKASALAEFLLTKDFCTTDVLVSTLNINSNDVPLLMSVVSTLYPEVTEKFGFSYQ